MKVKKSYFLIPLILLLLNTSIYAEEPEKSGNQNELYGIKENQKELQETKNDLKELERSFHILDKNFAAHMPVFIENLKRTEEKISELPSKIFIYKSLGGILTILALAVGIYGFTIKNSIKEIRDDAKENAEKTKKHSAESEKTLKESKKVLREIKKMREKSLEESSTIHSLAEKADELNIENVDKEKTIKEIKNDLSVYLTESDELAEIKKNISLLEESQKESEVKLESRIKDLSKITELAVAVDEKLPASHYNNRGILYEKLDRHDEALLDYNKAIELKPDYAISYSNRGGLYADLNRKEEALSDFDKAIELKPDHAIAYSNRGVFYGRLGRNEDALSDYKKAIELKPDYADAYLNLGELLIVGLKFDEAVKLLKENKKVFSSVRHKIVYLYLIQMALAGDGRDMKEFTHEHENHLKDNPDFKLENWSFKPIDNFLGKQKKEGNMPADRFKKMKEIHEEFKKLA